MSTRYDLSTSTYDWSVGSHSLTFVSQATGYRDADPSSPALTFEVYGAILTATHGTLSPTVTKIAPWETKTVTLTAETGYSVPASAVTPTGVTYTKTSSTTATITIVGDNVTGTVTLSLVCVNKLATPTGVEATGTVVSFNPVENAESYYIYADGSQIGTFTPAPPITGYNVSISSFAAGFEGFDDTDGALYSTDNGETWAKITSGMTLNSIEQIKFKLNIDWDPATVSTITSASLSLSLQCGGYHTAISENYILTQNVTDIEVVLSEMD